MAVSSEQVQNWLVYVSNPDEFVSWPRAEKIRFYQKVVDWHTYIARLRRQGFVERAWGAQKILGEQTLPIAKKTILVAKYKASVDKFSQLITEDPLWNHAVYYAPMLKSIEGDFEDDLARYNRVRERLELKLGRKLPAAQIKFQEQIPDVRPGGELEFLVTMRNGPGFADLTDEEKLAVEERVLQFHDYHAQLRQRRIITDDGACYPIWGFGMRKESAAMSGYWIVNVRTYDEFSALLLMDPLLVVMVHITVPLLPFEESQARAKRELTAARAQSK
jgi:hypothetical protein